MNARTFLAAVAGTSVIFLLGMTDVPLHPIDVTVCTPQSGNIAYPGFVPAPYPGIRYVWYDVYGMNYYQPPVNGHPTLAIEYENTAAVPATVIEFGLVAHGELLAEVRDVGTFSPNVAIKHEFGLDPDVFPIGTALARCVPLYIRFADGTQWRNPHLPELRHRTNPR